MNSRMYYPLAIVVLMFLLGIYLYPQLPAEVPTHWNAQGEIDDYSSREIAVFLIPAISLFVYAIFLAIPRIAVFKRNVDDFYSNAGPGFFTIFMLFMFGVYAFSLLAGLGYELSMTYFIIPALALLFGYMGYIMPTMKRNYFIGIRTPWTLSSDRVWKKTHEMGGKVFMGAGLLMLLTLLVPDYAFWSSIILIVAAALWTMVYSYLEFAREKRGRRKH
ncbi:hypothetical protein DRN67_00070 [Candidatus Micrarchaeota archaeon]|nr:MAG: hypothetical protein DRN67_00070 [Candidatus Micrarchaeota archaeon]